MVRCLSYADSGKMNEYHRGQYESPDVELNSSYDREIIGGERSIIGDSDEALEAFI